MRYLIDTNIFVYLSTDIESLSKDVAALIREPEAVLYISAESSVRELIVGYSCHYCPRHDGAPASYLQRHSF